MIIDIHADIREKAKAIRLLICDVDGVLTNGHITFDDENIEYKSFHVHDGLGLKMLETHNIERAIITSRKSSAMMRRMSELNISLVFQGQVDKRDAYRDVMTRLNLQDHEIAYIGDDLPDVPIINQVGLGVAVANANHFVKQQADYITHKNGGEGAVREVAEIILDAQGKLEESLSEYLP